MRRAEKAGRERAGRFLAHAPPVPSIQSKLDLALKHPPHTDHVDDHLLIGAHNLTGRALDAAYAAYDRGYRARLKEELERLQRGCSVCHPTHPRNSNGTCERHGK